MRSDDPDFTFHGIALDAPRPLTAHERTLAEFLIEPVATPALREQLARARVSGTCSCGCPSVTLESDAPPAAPGAGLVVHTAWTTRADGRDVEVSLHTLDGALVELEVWVGWDGGEVTTDLPPVADLRREPPA
jgi:hypothetical protein